MTEEQKNQIRNMRKDGIGYQHIANTLGLTRDAVRGYCRIKNLTGYGAAAKLNMAEQIDNGKLCLNCCNIIKQPKHGGRPKKFCSEKCRREWWKKHPENIHKSETAQYKLKCTYCGNEFISYGNKNRKYCCRECYTHDRFWMKEEGRE